MGAVAELEPAGVQGVVKARVGDLPRVSVVVPTLNEEGSLPAVLAAMPEGLHEIVLVDGHSTDDTIAVALACRPDIRVVLQQGRGKGDALCAGFSAATGDVIVMLDADGSTDPQEIPRFVDALCAGADFVKGSRHMEGGGSADFTRWREFGNVVLRGTVNAAFGVRYTDLCYGYNAFWADVLPSIDLDCDGFEVETLLNIRAARAGLKVVEVPSYEQPRIAGESKLHPIRDGLRVLRTIVTERFSRRPRQPAGELMPAALGLEAAAA